MGLGRPTTPAIGTLVVSLVVAAILGTAPSSAAPASSATEPPPQRIALEFVSKTPDFAPVVRDETVADASISSIVDDVIGSDEDVFAGGAWTGGEAHRQIYVKAGWLATATAMLEAAHVSPEQYALVEVPRSFKEMQDALLKVAGLLHASDVTFTSISPVPQTGELAMTASAGSPLVRALDPATSDKLMTPSIAGIIGQLEGFGVRWLAVREVGSPDSALYDDATPNMGSRIESAVAGCSSGYPIVIPALGISGLITAGHCLAGSWYNNGYFRGSQFTTTYPGAADVRGDWQILTGGTAAAAQRWIWTGAITANSPIQITAMQFNSYMSSGRQLCASGAYSGSTCRYYVVGSATYENDGTTDVYPVTTMDADFNANGVRAEIPEDCGGWTHGDSGGPTYYGNATGLTGYGIVTGSDKPSACGVRADNGANKGYFWWTTPVKDIKDFYPSDTAIGGFSRCSGAPCPAGG